MNHRRVQKELCLLVLNELDEHSQMRVREHLQSCSECRLLHDDLIRLRAELPAAAGSVDAERLLVSARAELMRTIRASSAQPLWSERLGEMIFGFPAQPYRTALGGVAVLAVGMLIGRTWLPVTGGVVPSLSPTPDGGANPETRITNVRFHPSPDGGNVVEVQYDELTPVRIRGTLQEPAIQKAVVRALVADDNPGVRLRAVATLSAPASSGPDREIKAALILALKSDPNAGVRKQALTALRRLPYDDEIKNAFIYLLIHDQNPGLRVDAINSLDSLAGRSVATDRALLDVLREKAERDENTYVQWRARAVLREAKIQ